MKSIKPGRGPSGINFIGSLFAIGFGVVWTVVAGSMAATVGGFLWLFPLFGLLFIGMGIVQAVYNYKNATGRNRYSVFDITEDGEEPDPSPCGGLPTGPASGYCPYCGAKAEAEYAFCRSCGRKLPKK